MSRLARGFLVCALLATWVVTSVSCAPPTTNIGEEVGAAAAIDVRGFPTRVVYGAPFEFELVRECAAPLELEPFDEARLAPLLVRTLSVETTRAHGRVVETRVLRAHALALGDTPLPEVDFRARFGGREESARLVWPPLLVESSLAEDDDGRAEMPLELLGPARSPLPLIVGALLAVLTAASVVVWRRRATAHAPSAAAPVADSHSDGDFYQWLGELHAAAGRSDRELYTTIVAMVRRATGVRLGRDLSSATARELVALVGDERLADPCAHAERACFAHEKIERAARAHDLDVVLRIVEEEREQALRGRASLERGAAR